MSGHPHARLPDQIRDLCEVFLSGLRVSLGAKLYGVYLYGVAAFDDGGALTDIDFHVLLNASLDDRERAEVGRLHATLAQEYPHLGGELDGYYLLLEEAQQATPPRNQVVAGSVDNSWALHCAHIHAGRCIILHGPDPAQIYPQPTWPELEHALESELEWLVTHLDRYPAYGVLNLCRLLYSFTTRDVVISKFASAQWASAAYPGWSPLIRAALSWYAGTATAGEQTLVRDGASSYYEYFWSIYHDLSRDDPEPDERP